MTLFNLYINKLLALLIQIRSEALHNSKEVINGHLAILAEDGEDMPKAATVAGYLAVEDYSGYLCL